MLKYVNPGVTVDNTGQYCGTQFLFWSFLWGSGWDMPKFCKTSRNLQKILENSSTNMSSTQNTFNMLHNNFFKMLRTLFNLLQNFPEICIFSIFSYHFHKFISKFHIHLQIFAEFRIIL